MSAVAINNSQTLLTRKNELQLAKLWREERNYEARERLVISYKPLLVSLAVEVGKETGHKVPHDDLVQEGSIALMEALEKFDINRGLGLGTYARSGILSKMRRYVMDMGQSCRIGTNANDKIVFFRGRKIRADFEREVGREVLNSDVAELAKRAGVPVDAWNRMNQRMTSGDISLDVGYTHGDIDEETEDHSISSQLHSHEISPEEATQISHDREATRAILEEAIQSLPDPEKMVITHRLVAPLSERMSYQKLAKQMRLSKKSVREREEKGKALIRIFLYKRNFQFQDAFL